MRHVLSYFKCVLYLRSLHKFSSILSVTMSTLESVWRPSRRWGITVGQMSRKVLCWEEQHQRHCPGWTLSPSGMSYVVLGSWPNLSEPPFVIHKIAVFLGGHENCTRWSSVLSTMPDMQSVINMQAQIALFWEHEAHISSIIKPVLKRPLWCFPTKAKAAPHPSCDIIQCYLIHVIVWQRFHWAIDQPGVVGIGHALNQ